MKFPSFLKIAVVSVKYLFEINRDGNNIWYNGIEAELLTSLFKLLRFKFEIVVQRDNAWVFKDSFGDWNGIIGMLEREEGYVRLSHLDITSARKEVVGFSFSYDVADETFAIEFSQPFPIYAAFV